MTALSLPIKSLFDKWFERCFIGLSLGVILGLFFSVTISSVSSILLLILAIFHSLVIKHLRLKNWWVYGLFCITFIFYVIGLLNSENLAYGLKVITKSLSLVLFPVTFFLLPPIKRETIDTIGYGFSLIALISIFYSITIWLINAADSQSNSIMEWVNMLDFTTLSNPLDIQPTYWAAFIGFAVIFLTIQLLQKNSITLVTKTIMVLSIVLFCLVITLLSTRIVMLALALFFFISLLYWGYIHKKLIYIIIVLFMGLTALGIITYSLPNLKERVKEAVNYKNEYGIDKQWGGRALRILKWKCSLHLIGNNVLSGVGTGDGMDQLQQCYVERDYRALTFWPDVKYNTHNQFLQVFLFNGVLAFLAFLFSILWPLVKAFKQKDFLYISFILLFVIICLTESFLLRNKGIVFYSFINVLLCSGLLNAAEKEQAFVPDVAHLEGKELA